MIAEFDNDPDKTDGEKCIAWIKKRVTIDNNWGVDKQIFGIPSLEAIDIQIELDRIARSKINPKQTIVK